MVAAAQAPGEVDLDRAGQSVVLNLEEDADIRQGIKIIDVVPADTEVTHPVVAGPRGIRDEAAAVHAVHHALTEPVVASRVAGEVLLDAAREVHGIVGLDLLDCQRVRGDFDLFEVLDLGGLERDNLYDERILAASGIGFGRAGIRVVDEGAGRHRAPIVEPVVQRHVAQVVIHADEIAFDDRDGLEEVEMKMRAVVLEVHARGLLDFEPQGSNGKPASGAERKGQREAALRVRAAFADLPPGKPEGAAPELEVQVVNRRAVAAIAGEDDAPDQPAVAVSGGKLRTPRKQPSRETLPGSAKPPELVEDPLDHDCERTVDYLRLTDLEIVDAAQPGTEERIPLRFVTDSGLALAMAMISRVESGCVAVWGTVIWRHYDQMVPNVGKTLVPGWRNGVARFVSLGSGLRVRL